jgi:hypothetical protein
MLIEGKKIKNQDVLCLKTTLTASQKLETPVKMAKELTSD